MRLREYSDSIPKPMVPIGSRPVLWHLMKYYAHFGHTEFIVCLGYQGAVIKDYFLRYNETVSNDFVLSQGGHAVELLSSDIDDWKITFVDTGMHANIGERLARVRAHLDPGETFLANYSDGLSDLDLDAHVAAFNDSGKVASMLAVRSTQSFHFLDVAKDGNVSGIDTMSDRGLWINGGFFVLKPEVFDYIEAGEDLVEQPFRRLISADLLHATTHDGFWMPMDTFKDKQAFEDRFQSGETPWVVWNSNQTISSSL